jgi:hypothetical protein
MEKVLSEEDPYEPLVFNDTELPPQLPIIEPKVELNIDQMGTQQDFLFGEVFRTPIQNFILEPIIYENASYMNAAAEGQLAIEELQNRINTIILSWGEHSSSEGITQSIHSWIQEIQELQKAFPMCNRELVIFERNLFGAILDNLSQKHFTDNYTTLALNIALEGMTKQVSNRVFEYSEFLQLEQNLRILSETHLKQILVLLEHVDTHGFPKVIKLFREILTTHQTELQYLFNSSIYQESYLLINRYFFDQVYSSSYNFLGHNIFCVKISDSTSLINEIERFLMTTKGQL